MLSHSALIPAAGELELDIWRQQRQLGALPLSASTQTDTHDINPIMASNIEQSPFFQQQKSRGELVVKGTICATHHFKRQALTPADAPKFDLESYIANYSGMDCTLQIE